MLNFSVASQPLQASTQVITQLSNICLALFSQDSGAHCLTPHFNTIHLLNTLITTTNMPAVQVDTAKAAREVANLVARVTNSRTSSVSRTARTGMRAIGGGIIAAIVIGGVIFIALLVVAFCLVRRHKRQSVRRQQEMQKYYGDNRSSIGTADPGAPAPGQAGYGNAGQTGGYGYSQGTGYGYAHTAQPGQAGYGVPPMAPAHTADHGTHAK
ncbi:hypothetical protein CTA1_4232 [Colletotrichum tanaceti]|uniref:Uncharacterized protein n=1 Tax=Colletotrichum tanaceti TaxID=1306861 RepID=A0A4U6XIZ0_9PEZI|nr:hypothetical protein CTA1_4232 [Colletotrichum tanaceti]